MEQDNTITAPPPPIQSALQTTAPFSKLIGYSHAWINAALLSSGYTNYSAPAPAPAPVSYPGSWSPASATANRKPQKTAVPGPAGSEVGELGVRGPGQVTTTAAESQMSSVHAGRPQLAPADRGS